MIRIAREYQLNSPSSRGDILKNLLEKYQLIIAEHQQIKPVNFKPLPYYYFLESSLESRTGQDINLKISQDENGEDWYWADLTINNKNVRIGFSSTHINAQPPLVLMLLLLVGGLATLVTAAALVQYLTTPLENLSKNALRVGSGEKPELIPEIGPEEMVVLARSFNKMAVQVQEL